MAGTKPATPCVATRCFHSAIVSAIDVDGMGHHMIHKSLVKATRRSLLGWVFFRAGEFLHYFLHDPGRFSETRDDSRGLNRRR